MLAGRREAARLAVFDYIEAFYKSHAHALGVGLPITRLI